MTEVRNHFSEAPVPLTQSEPEVIMDQQFRSSAEQLHRESGSDLMARGLGVFSLILGAMRGQERLVQAYGAREILTGAAILTARDPTPWIWVRVAGDAIDIASLAAAYAARGGNARQRRETSRGISMALFAVLGVTMLDYLNARRLTQEKHEPWQTDIDFASRSGFPNREMPMRHGRARSAPADVQQREASDQAAPV